MPQHSQDYARLIQENNIDVVGIQEGVDDWELKTKWPTDYQRAEALQQALGKCWQHKFQIFINHCQGTKFISSGRFDLTDGPHATRTGEFAVLEKSGKQFFFVNVHWDHESRDTRIANAQETSELLQRNQSYPQILLGDFNAQCNGSEVNAVKHNAQLNLLHDAGIDCLFTKGFEGNAKKINAEPSDHPGIVAKLSFAVEQS